MKNITHKVNLSVVVAICLWAFLTIPVHAQSTLSMASHRLALRVTEVSQFALNDPRPLDLVVVPRSVTGAAPGGAGEGSRTLRYTTVNVPGATRSISVQWKPGDSAPTGTSLKIAATSVPDRCGLAAPEVTVGSAPQSLITGIPSCTTDAAARGALLRYRLSIEDESLTAGGTKTEVSIIFTILDM
jgi:hypothetical protein